MPPAATARTARDDVRWRFAMSYARAGLPVFVLGRSKRPLPNCYPCRTAAFADGAHDREACGCLTCHGFYAATTDLDRLQAMLVAAPHGLLALRTGAVAGRVVVDIDPRDGGRLDRNLMRPTASVAAGGLDGGWHLHYAHPGGYVPSRKLPGHPGVDIKGDGGYVVLPPSIHPASGREYRWVRGPEVREMHPALAELARTPQPPSPVPERESADVRTVAFGRRPGCISSPAALLAAHLDAVARAPEGRRRRTLYGAARGVARMVAAGALSERQAWAELTSAGQAAGQTAAQTRNAILGGFRAEGVSLTFALTYEGSPSQTWARDRGRPEQRKASR